MCVCVCVTLFHLFFTLILSLSIYIYIYLYIYIYKNCVCVCVPHFHISLTLSRLVSLSIYIYIYIYIHIIHTISPRLFFALFLFPSFFTHFSFFPLPLISSFFHSLPIFFFIDAGFLHNFFLSMFYIIFAVNFFQIWLTQLTEISNQNTLIVTRDNIRFFSKTKKLLSLSDIIPGHFEYHWVPLSYGLVLNLSNKLSKLLRHLWWCNG